MYVCIKEMNLTSLIELSSKFEFIQAFILSTEESEALNVVYLLFLKLNRDVLN